MQGTQEILRCQLNSLIEKKESLQDPEVIKKSQELDEVIVFNTIINEFLKLIDYTHCIEMATGYKGPERPNMDGITRQLMRLKEEDLNETEGMEETPA